MNVRNHVQLIGNLGKDPELKKFNEGKMLLNASLAVSSSYRNKEGKQITDTQWHQLKAWGKTAELMEKLLKKGNQVAVFGKLDMGEYEDKEGNKKYFTSIVVNDFFLMNKSTD